MTRLRRTIEQEGNAPLLGVGSYQYSPAFLEIAAGLGFRAAWFDMEHCQLSFSDACDLCRIASGLGMLTMIRIPNARRENVLRAAECGPDIIDVPMAESPEMLHDLIRYARFRPEGERGSFPSSRAVRYGLADSLAEQKRVDQDLCLMIQIETGSAVARAEELCAVPGIDILIGPADLSASLGVPYQTGHQRVREAAGTIVRTARAHGKLVAVASPAADFRFWIEQRVDVIYCASDVDCMKIGAQDALRRMHEARESLS